MEALTKLGSARRWWIPASGGLLGILVSSLGPASGGCIYPDHCIKVTSPGHDWCRNLANAIQWPAGGSLDDAEPVLDAEGDAPKGCVCFNDAEDQILDDEVPACRYEQLIEEIEQAAREECQSLVLPGYDHNCWTATGPQASTPGIEFFGGAGACIGNCE
ncbi:MAG: hypothetical protein KDK70_24540, partial [Myxococcales bacterium]|nr:hypothetical protein [Myxococcales bacterium]